MKLKIKSLLWILIFVTFSIRAQSISVSGQWDLVVSVGDLPTGTPGENVNSTYENTAGDVTLSFNTGTFLWGRSYRIDVQRSDVNWNTSFQLRVRRTSGGSILFGSVNGGTSYQIITLTAQQFLSGSTWLGLNIPLQYQLSGVSATLPASTYQTTIIYTLVLN